LVAAWGQAETRTNVARVLEPINVIDRGYEGHRGDWSNTGHTHEALQGGLAANEAAYLAINGGDLQDHQPTHLRQLGNQTADHRVTFRQFFSAPDQGVAVACPEDTAPLPSITQTLISLSDTSSPT
jgi:hypothetical protein